MKLIDRHEVYGELRKIQHEVQELAIDQNLDVAAARIERIKRRIFELIRASEDAEMRKKKPQPIR